MFASVDRRLTFAVVALGGLQGLLLPAFTVATGALAARLETKDAAAGIVLLLGLLFTVQRLLDPVIGELGSVLMREVDESLTERVMRAMASPPGLAHVEDPVVLDAALQAQGALSGFTPGSAAVQLPFIIKRRLWCASSLMIVGSFRWWLVPLLGVAYALVFRFVRRHNDEVTMVMHGNTDLLRRAYYLRTLSLTSTVAKETRVFGLAPWLVDRYRSSWLDVMGGVWARRREYWIEMVAVTAALVAVEAVGFSLLAREASAGRISVGVAVAVSQAFLAAALAAQFD